MHDNLIIDVEMRGMGDFLFSVLLSIFLKKKFSKIYIYYGAVHFNNDTLYLINRLFQENDTNNILCIGNVNYKEPKPLPSDQFMYFDNPNLPEEIKNTFKNMYDKLEFDTDNNCLWSYSILNTLLENTDVYYQHILRFFKTNMKEVSNSINFRLNTYELNENINLYKKLINKIDNQKYVLVFHCIERKQYNFAFRDYPHDLNKNNYKVIYMCNGLFGNNLTTYDKNICYINELLDTFPPMYMLHEIIENAEEIHMIDSYPFHYSFLLKNIHHKIKIYPRAITGYCQSTSFSEHTFNLKINNNYISSLNIEMFFDRYESYYPINYFKYINNNIFPLIQEFNKEELSNYKLLPMTGIDNGTGILVETISSKINFIEFSLKNIDKLENIYKSINNFIDVINNNNLSTLKESLNILLIQTDGDYFLKMKPFQKEINEEDIYLETNIDSIDKNLINIIDFYIGNNNIHYIYPYKNENDKKQFVEKIQIKSSEIFNNNVDFTNYNIV